jgi:hypothetical protein
MARGEYSARKFSLEPVSDFEELKNRVLQDLKWNEKPTVVLSRNFISN